MIPLSWYLILAALLFGIGLFGVLARKNVIAILLSIELMLNAVNINLLAFWRYLTPEDIAGQKWQSVWPWSSRCGAGARFLLPMSWTCSNGKF